MKHRTAFGTAKLVVVALIAAGGFFAAAGGASAKPDLNDGTITVAVKNELMVDPGVPGYAVDVETSGGIVTLSGTVDNIRAKDRAAFIAETVKGVRAVVNRIHVEPAVDRSDADIRADVVRELAEDPATDVFEVIVNVEGSVVKLTGNVDSWAERRLCSTLAKGIAGVTDVKNLISVEFAQNRFDAEIKKDIVERMRWNALLDSGLVNVEVKDGKVTLSGTVGSAAEKREALDDAYVAGASSVDASGLQVARWARDEDLRRNKTGVTDEKIRKAIEDALMVDPRVASFGIKVDVDRGIATLRGAVDNLKARQSAAQDARNTVGVVWVKNRIDVKPQEEISDAQIENRVQDALNRNALLAPYTFDVKVSNGVAALSGSVASNFERSRAENVAARVQGVSHVKNRLAVYGDDLIPYKRYAYDPYPYDYGWYRPITPFRRYTPKTDTQLKEDIQDELWWSPFVDEEQVTVTVENHEARLTGKVDSWSEHQAATDNAFEAGAVDVDNDLEVTTR